MRDMTFHGYHGVLAEEKSLGQKFVLDVTMSACHRAAGASDDIADTVDYARAFDRAPGTEIVTRARFPWTRRRRHF